MHLVHSLPFLQRETIVLHYSATEHHTHLKVGSTLQGKTLSSGPYASLLENTPIDKGDTTIRVTSLESVPSPPSKSGLLKSTRAM